MSGASAPSVRGDFLIRRAPNQSRPTPDGFVEVFAGEDVALLIRRGWGLAADVSERGAAVILGSTIEPRERIVGRAMRLLVDQATDPSPAELDAFFADLVGHFACVIARGRSVWSVTDHLGSIPVFVHEGPSPIRAISTSIDAAVPDSSRTLDETSVREFVATGRIASPSTIFAAARRQPPATVLPSDSSGSRPVPYWRPPERSRRDLAAAAAEYRSGLRQILGDLRTRTKACTLMYSGGEDARVIGAFAAQAGLAVNGVIFLDGVNRELRHARSAARRSHVSLEMRTRLPRHDADDLLRMVVVNDAGVDLLHAHARGLIRREHDPMPVLDGWYAALSKGEQHPQSRRTWRGIPLGLARESPPGQPPFRVDESVTARWADKDALFDHLPVIDRLEWSQSYPASDDETFGFFAFNQRSFPGISPLALHPLVDIAGSLPAELRLNRTFFRTAFGRSIGSAAFVPRTDGEILGLGPRLDVAATAVNKATYKLSDRITRRSSGPWQTNAVRREAARIALQGCNRDVLDELCRISPHARTAVSAEGAAPHSAWRWAHRTAQIAHAVTAGEMGTHHGE